MMQTYDDARRFVSESSGAGAGTGLCAGRDREPSLSDSTAVSIVAIGSCTTCPACLNAVQNEGSFVGAKCVLDHSPWTLKRFSTRLIAFCRNIECFPLFSF